MLWMVSLSRRGVLHSAVFVFARYKLWFYNFLVRKKLFLKKANEAYELVWIEMTALFKITVYLCIMQSEDTWLKNFIKSENFLF